jgi:hypothetical protein
VPSSFIDSYRIICARCDFDPDNTQYKLQVKRFYNANLRHVATMNNWIFTRKIATVSVLPDYAVGTALLTNGSRIVLGTGTTWTTAMEGMWINPSITTTSFDPSLWARVGRVLGAGSILLEYPWQGSNYIGTTYTLRQRYVQMPRDCFRYQTLLNEQQQRGRLIYKNPYEFDRQFSMSPLVVGTPWWYTDAPVWNGPTPDRALTVAARAGGSLSESLTYTYKYTWTIGGSETGASGEVSYTPAGGNDTARLTGIQDTGVTDGRYLNLYRSESDVGVFYFLNTYSNVSQIDDDGSITPDRNRRYFDSNNVQFVRVFPYNGDTVPSVTTIRYQYVPNEIIKDSDYPDLPNGDALEAVQMLTIADVIAKAGNDAVANTWRAQATARIKEMERTQLDQEPNQIVRQPWVGGYGGMWAYVPNPAVPV